MIPLFSVTVPFVRSNPQSKIFGCGFVTLLVDEVELETELLEDSGGFVVLLVTEVELEAELLEDSGGFVVLLVTEVKLDVELPKDSDGFVVLLITEVELAAELLEDSGGFVVLLVIEVELAAELLADSDVFVVLFDVEFELDVELLDVLSLCDIIGGEDTLFDELSPLLQAVTERHSKTADKTAIILFILYTSFRYLFQSRPNILQELSYSQLLRAVLFTFSALYAVGCFTVRFR